MENKEQELVEKVESQVVKLLAIGSKNDLVCVTGEAKDIIALVREHDGWVSVAERLPRYGQMVALIDIERYANNGDIKVDNEHVNMCGYLHNFGSDYWSIYGDRGTQVNAFTHWRPLPSPPTTEKE